MIRTRHGSLRRAGPPLLLLLAAPLAPLAFGGCGEDNAGPSPTPVVSERGPGGGRGTGSAAPEVVLPAVAGQLPAPRDRRAERQAPAFPPEPGGGGGGGAPTGEEDEDEPTEDPLPRALQAAFGAPTDCVSEETRGRLHDTLSVRVTVRVLPSGRPVSADVSGARLSDTDLECMRARALALRLPGPVADAPRTVAATITYQVASARAETEQREAFLSFGLPEPGGSAPNTGAVAAPGTTLPAGGAASGRPTGFVAPSSTLPAVTP
jgi:hypothetical protein